jgi:hypothetical protein
VGLRFNPPPNWPPIPGGVTPESGWQPDPSWPAPPAGWQLWVNDDEPAGQTVIGTGPADAGQTWVSADAPGWGGAPGWGQQPPPPDGPPGYGAPGYGQPGSGQPGSGVPGQYGGPFQPPPRQPFSMLSVLAFIFSIIGIVPVGFVLAILALKRIGRSGERGRGMAVTSLLLSSVWIVIIGLAVLGAVLAKPGLSGNIKHPEAVSVFALEKGDCFDNPPPGEGGVANVLGLPCTKAHNAQVFAVYKLTGSVLNYPPNAVGLAKAGCNARKSSINQSDVNSSMKLAWLYPEEPAWLQGRRTVTCFVVNPAKTLTSSPLNP